MRLALLVLLAACGGEATRPPTSGAPPSPAVAAPSAPAPAAAAPAAKLLALAGSAGACGGFEQRARDSIDVVEGRLRVAAPKGAADIPKAYDIMGAPEPTSHESRVIVENGHGGKFVVFARELWQAATPDLATRATGYFHSTMQGAQAEIGTLDADPAIGVIGAKPTAPDQNQDAILVLAALVRATDGSLLTVDYYVNPAGFGAGCTGLAVELARGIQRGARALDLKGGKRTLGGQVDVDVPAGYVVTHQPGPDFDVFYLRKLAPLGEYPGHLLVYLGDYADTTVPSGDGTAVSRKGTLAGEPASWQGYTSPHHGAVVATVSLRGRAQLQVAEVATLHGDYLDELDAIARTVRKH